MGPRGWFWVGTGRLGRSAAFPDSPWGVGSICIPFGVPQLLGGITVFLSILCAQVCETVSHPVSEEPHSPGSGWWGSLITVLGAGE